MHKDNLSQLLSKREKEVFSLILEGNKTMEIAKKLNIKPNTASTIKRIVFFKLGVKSSIELFKYAFKNGMIKI